MCSWRTFWKRMGFSSRIMMFTRLSAEWTRRGTDGSLSPTLRAPCSQTDLYQNTSKDHRPHKIESRATWRSETAKEPPQRLGCGTPLHCDAQTPTRDLTTISPQPARYSSDRWPILTTLNTLICNTNNELILRACTYRWWSSSSNASSWHTG
jgi:hypothetical protein